jgi:hypothetical protein
VSNHYLIFLHVFTTSLNLERTKKKKQSIVAPFLLSKQKKKKKKKKHHHRAGTAPFRLFFRGGMRNPPFRSPAIPAAPL